jgi:23S rRNA (guanine2445-N2)-methyltransferase / 23S rRNA (guanine2069-N7)-methyltransferase
MVRFVQEKYDLIFLDPPTFSNRKKEGLVFDIQRDHPLLIRLAMERLADAGLLIFSTNFRRFCLSPEISAVFLIKDISKSSLPFDFTRDKRIHRCWEIRKKQEVGYAD